MSASRVSAEPRRRLAPDERRAQILRVADEIFRSHPYGEVSLGEIADAAGITRGLIAHHFGTKRELYVEVVRRLMRVPTLPLPEAGGSVRARLAASVDAWLTAIEESKDLYLAATSTAGMGDPEIAAIVDEMRDASARRLAEVLELGPADELTPVRLGLLRSWEALAEGAIRQWLEYGRMTRAQVQRLMVETAARAAEGLIENLEADLPPAA